MTDIHWESLSEAVVRTIREPLLILDSDLRVRSANPAFYNVFQADEEGTVGRPLFELGDGGWDVSNLRELMDEVLPRDHSVEGFEVDAVFPTVGRRVLELNARRLEREGTPYILLAIQDMTDWRRAQEELERSNQELERFAYVASHDLQEPLRMVASYTQLLARRYEGELDERADKYIAYAVEGAERMKDLIKGLLRYSRLGTSELDRVPTDPDEVVGEVLRDLRKKIQETRAQITRDPLPEVFVDPDQLRQVLQNLLENALKFSGDGPPVVHLSGRERDGWVEIAVRDEGPGIDDDYSDQVFVMFKRLHGRETEGSGLGLALCRRMVERHGGRIWVESESGAGSVFRLTLPATEETAMSHPEPKR